MYKIIGADGREYGPIPLEVLRQWISEGRADARTRVLVEGTAQWRTLWEVPELSGLLGAAPAPAAPAAAAAGAAPRTNSLAVSGLVLGILGLPGAACCCGLPLSLLGLIFSGIALSQIRSDPAGQQGRGIAVAGLVLSALGLLSSFLVWVLRVHFGMPYILRHLQNR